MYDRRCITACDMVIAHCDEALDAVPNYVKALWRKAKALEATNNRGDAIACLEKLLTAEPANKAALQTMPPVFDPLTSRLKPWIDVHVLTRQLERHNGVATCLGPNCAIS